MRGMLNQCPCHRYPGAPNEGQERVRRGCLSHAAHSSETRKKKEQGVPRRRHFRDILDRDAAPPPGERDLSEMESRGGFRPQRGPGAVLCRATLLLMMSSYRRRLTASRRSMPSSSQSPTGVCSALGQPGQDRPGGALSVGFGSDNKTEALTLCTALRCASEQGHRCSEVPTPRLRVHTPDPRSRRTLRLARFLGAERSY